MTDVHPQQTPRPHAKRPLDEPLMRSPKTLRPGSECSPRASCCVQQRTKRSAPFDENTWRSPSKLHKAGSLEQVRPAEQASIPLPPPPGLANDGGDMDVDEEPAPVGSTSTCTGEQQQQSVQWGCMFGKLGLTETSSSRTSPLYGMASENKRPVGAMRPSTSSTISPEITNTAASLLSPPSTSAISPAAANPDASVLNPPTSATSSAAATPADTNPDASLLSLPTETAPATQGSSGSAQSTSCNETKRQYQYGFSQQCTLFFLRNQLN